MKASATNSRYTKYEDNIIVTEYEKGDDYVSRISNRINRTPSSIRTRIKVLKEKHLISDINNKIKGIEIYLITTIGCQACVIQQRLLDNFIIKHNSIIRLHVSNFIDSPSFIKLNVKMHDYPITVIVKDNVIKYSFVGTRSIKEIEEIFNDLKLW